MMQISSATEIAVELNRAYNTSIPIFKIVNFIQQNISRWYLGFLEYCIFEHMAFSFLQKDCCESEKICNVFDND